MQNSRTQISGALGGLTVILGLPTLGFAQAIFLGTGVAAFTMAAIYFFVRLSAIAGVFQRLSVESFGFLQLAFDPATSTLTHINLMAKLKNDSQRLLFYRLRRAYVSIAKQTSADHKVDENVLIIAVGGTAQIQFSTIGNVQMAFGGGEAPKGVLELEVEYGSTPEHLPYLFRHVAEIHLVGSLSDQPGGTKALALAPITAIRQLEHKRA